MKHILCCAAIAALCACGGSSPASAWRALNNICAHPRSGTGDKQGTLDDEKKFLKAWSDDLYLWYGEIPSADPSQYPTAIDYFNVLKTPAKTASNHPKDKFHFTYDTTAWNQLSQSGVEAGYGFQVVLRAASPPREALVAYTEGPPATDPANSSIIQRGSHIVSIDGAAMLDGSATTLNNGLFPAAAGQSHTFVFQDPDPSTTQHTVTLTSVNVTHATVQNVGPVTGTPTVGYMQFNDHLATAEKALIDAVNQLKAANITDLVLDIRYNGGGYLAIASELAYMIAGPGPTSGKTFELTKFNDKHPVSDPVTGETLQPTPFYNQTVGLSVNAGQGLPHLDLPRVFILTGGSTCSASESVINSLRGVNVQVIQIGTTTCGKPYGFYPQDNCGTTYFSIQFQGVNAKGFGDYSDGFTPSSTDSGSNIAGCLVADDFSHPLGNPAEARLAAALQYRASPGSCPPASMASSRSGALTAVAAEGVMPKAPWRENRLYLGR